MLTSRFATNLAPGRSGGAITRRVIACAAALFVSLSFTSIRTADADNGLVRVAASHVPEEVASAKPLGHRGFISAMTLDFVLPLRNQAKLEDEIKRIGDPKDSLYGQYLTPQQFASEYGPSLDDVNAVAKFAASKGLTLKDVSGNRTLIKVSGSSPAVETAFGVHLNDYQARDGRTFFAPDREPLFPSDIARRIVGIAGLDNAAVIKPSRLANPATPTAGLPDSVQPLGAEQPQSLYGGGNKNYLTPGNVRSIYGFPSVTSPGSGQTLGLFELDGYTASDISTYNHDVNPGVSLAPLQNVLVDGFNGSPTTGPNSGASEVTLDIEMMVGICPYAGKIYVYEAPNTLQDSADEYAKIASDDLAQVVSSSWGYAENGTSASSDAVSENQSFQQMARQGQSIFCASGDAGAYANQSSTSYGTLSVQNPSSQPYVTAVGGTFLNDTSSYAYVSESAWGDSNANDRGARGLSGAGSGGGISAWWSFPSYQQGFISSASLGSTGRRNVPDVSLFGDYDEGYYGIIFQNTYEGSNGTSAAAPLWAAYIALVNQGRAGHGSPKIGFINPAVYSLASNTATYNNDFHDVADGSTNLYYPAVTGYDLATGLGTPKAASLYADLVQYGTAQTVVPISLTFNPNQIAPGATTTGTVTLNGPAPAGGITVPVTFNGSAVATAAIAAGSRTGTVGITVSANTAPGAYTFVATYNGTGVNGILTVTSGTQRIVPISLTFNPNPIVPSEYATGTVTLNGPAPAGGITVPVTFNGSAFAAVAIAAGSATGTFGITAGTGTGSYTLVATYNGTTVSGTLTVTALAVQSLTFNPNPILPGATTTGTVTLNGPAPSGGVSVPVTYNGAAFATVAIAAGSATGTFGVRAGAGTGSYQFFASYNGSGVYGTLTVN